MVHLNSSFSQFYLQNRYSSHCTLFFYKEMLKSLHFRLWSNPIISFKNMATRTKRGYRSSRVNLISNVFHLSSLDPGLWFISVFKNTFLLFLFKIMKYRFPQSENLKSHTFSGINLIQMTWTLPKSFLPPNPLIPKGFHQFPSCHISSICLSIIIIDGSSCFCPYEHLCTSIFFLDCELSENRNPCFSWHLLVYPYN